MISVIVPAYNVEDVFEDCVNSVLNSTFRDYELILVDDGSTDRTPELCDRFASIDERVRVIHQPNAGVAAARNAGIGASKGDFITFVDSDDFVHPRMLELLWNAVSCGDFDMSMTLHRRIEASEKDHYLNCQLKELDDVKSKELTQEDYMSAMFTDLKGYYWGPCHKLFKRSLIFSQENGFIAFKPIPAEDAEWMTRVILILNKYVLLPLDLYFYNMRAESQTHADSERMVNDIIIGRLETHYQCLNLIPKDKPKYRELCLKDIYRRMLLYSYRAHSTTYEVKARSECKKIYKATIKEYLQMPFSRMAKMKTVVYHHCPWVYRWLVGFGEWLVKAKLIKG